MVHAEGPYGHIIAYPGPPKKALSTVQHVTYRIWLSGRKGSLQIIGGLRAPVRLAGRK